MSVRVLTDAEVRIRSYRQSDARSTLDIFTRAVLLGALSRYTHAQRDAWLGHRELTVWAEQRRALQGWVAEALEPEATAPNVRGFVEIDGDEITMLFVDPDATRRGIGSALLRTAVEHARACELAAVVANVSLIAEPVFARAGFSVVERQQVSRAGQILDRALMRRSLA